MKRSIVVTFYGLAAIQVAESSHRLPLITRKSVTRFATSIGDARKHLHDSTIEFRAAIGPLLDDISPGHPENIEDAIRGLPEPLHDLFIGMIPGEHP